MVDFVSNIFLISLLIFKKKCNLATIDLVFVLDTSGSNNFPRVLNFVGDIVNGLEIGPDEAEVAVIRFADKVSVIFGLTAMRLACLHLLMALGFQQTQIHTCRTHGNWNMHSSNLLIPRHLTTHHTTSQVSQLLTSDIDIFQLPTRHPPLVFLPATDIPIT